MIREYESQGKDKTWGQAFMSQISIHRLQTSAFCLVTVLNGHSLFLFTFFSALVYIVIHFLMFRHFLVENVMVVRGSIPSCKADQNHQKYGAQCLIIVHNSSWHQPKYIDQPMNWRKQQNYLDVIWIQAFSWLDNA